MGAEAVMAKPPPLIEAIRYHTHCDPGLNGLQAAEMAHRVAELIRNMI
jgi:3-deoxy-D-arabino-heptulosonate 7-phosphate (DAHP) synthase class II